MDSAYELAEDWLNRHYDPDCQFYKGAVDVLVHTLHIEVKVKDGKHSLMPILEGRDEG